MWGYRIAAGGVVIHQSEVVRRACYSFGDCAQGVEALWHWAGNAFVPPFLHRFARFCIDEDLVFFGWDFIRVEEVGGVGSGGLGAWGWGGDEARCRVDAEDCRVPRRVNLHLCITPFDLIPHPIKRQLRPQKLEQIRSQGCGNERRVVDYVEIVAARFFAGFWGAEGEVLGPV